MTSPYVLYQRGTLTFFLPDGTIEDAQEKVTAQANVTPNIFGNPVKVRVEVADGDREWTLRTAYVPLSLVQDVLAAYYAHTVLDFVEQSAAPVAVVIQSYPGITRYKTTTGQVLYTISLVLRSSVSGLPVPPILSTTGPRLFA